MSTTSVGLPSLVRRQRVAAGPRSAACALGLGSVVLLGFADGGYYASTSRAAGVALVAAAGLALLLRREDRLGPLERLAVAALAGLSAWMLLASLWGVEGTEALREAERGAVYAAALAAFLLVIRRSTARALLTGVLGGCVVLAIWALVDRQISGAALDPYQGGLLEEPVGYANALGLLMAIGVVLALGLFAESSGRHARWALLGAAGVTGVALALTSSRGAWLATLVGLGILAARRIRSARVVVPIAIGAAVLALLTLPRPSLGDRPAYWGVAVAGASDRPLLGSGAGSFDDIWLEERPIPAFVRDAHSLYLETAAELGVAGLALLLLALGAPLVAAVRARGRPTVAPAAAAYSVFLVHAGLDWDWEMPVTVLAGLACGAAVLASARGSSRSRGLAA